jgi:hypothetical protein
MTSEDDACRAEFAELQRSLVTALTASGALGKLRAQLRLASLAVLRDDAHSLDAVVPSRLNLQQLSPGQRLGLLLVDEFLSSLNLSLTKGILEEEAAIGAIRASNPPGLDRMPQTDNAPALLALIAGALGPVEKEPLSREDPTDWSSSGKQRAPSPSVERSAASTASSVTAALHTVTEITTTEVIVSSSSKVTSGVSTASAPQQRRGSSLPSEADYEPSVDYSDRSLASSLDITEFDHMEVVKQPAAASASTSDDDF